jgi:flavin-dependent dehydrogenase
MHTDVLVIGGGPAGLAAAIAARLKGFEVTAVDAAHPPIDKACGEGILPAGVEALRRLGVRLSAEDGCSIRGIRFIDKDSCVEANFPAGHGMALRRTRLHQILCDRATEVGVRLHWGTRATFDVGESSTRWIVGADGQKSGVRLAAGLEDASLESLRFGFRRHYRMAPWTDFVEVHWGPRCQIYVTPVSGNEIGIALLSRDSHLRLDVALEDFPELQRRLQDAEQVSTERGEVTASRALRRVCSAHTALIGDASGSVDAITGDGLSLSFLQAIALSEALASADLAAYQKQHRRLAETPAWIARMLLGMDRFPRFRRGVFRVLALAPWIFAKLLAIHTAPLPKRVVKKPGTDTYFAGFFTTPKDRSTSHSAPPPLPRTVSPPSKTS